jgi:ribonuclease BN (tRNA processing enzyme)
MNIRFIGVGTQSSGPDQYHSNMIITSRTGRRMLVDCGSDVRFALAECGLRAGDLDAVYISHLHSDHIGGMEWLAFATYFSGERKRPLLFGEHTLLNRLWNSSLKGGLECLRQKRMELSDYFDCHAVTEAAPFDWEGLRFTPVKMLHVVGDQCSHHSYGLIIENCGTAGSTLFISTDALFQPELLQRIAERADVIFHDCETSLHQSNVHAHYDQLRTLPDDIRRKTWLYHYQPGTALAPCKDGFRGFVVKGQEFLFPD